MKLSTILLSSALFAAATHATTSVSTPTSSAAETSRETSSSSEEAGSIEDDEISHQLSLDAISHEWKQICDNGCQPGTWPSDASYISQFVVPELISIQYKPNCTARPAHLKYLREIFECSGRRDLCLDIDKKTRKCRDQAMRKVTSSLKHMGEGGMDCERDEDWREDFYRSVLDFMKYFKTKMCRGAGVDGMRDCKLMVCSFFFFFTKKERLNCMLD